MLTRIDFFPDSVLNAREEILEPRFTAEEIEARADAKAAAAALKRTPEAIAERAARIATYVREREERRRMAMATELAEHVAASFCDSEKRLMMGA